MKIQFGKLFCWTYLEAYKSVRPLVCYHLFSRLAHYSFQIFGTNMQNGNAQNVTEPDFGKKIGQSWAIGEQCVVKSDRKNFSKNF